MLALKIGVFLLTLSLGIIASALGGVEVRDKKRISESAVVDHTCHPTADDALPIQCRLYEPDGGSGTASCSGTTRGLLESELPGDEVKASDTRTEEAPKVKITSSLKITYKQKAHYTAEARSNGIQGTVTLRVTFLASGGIGSITTVKGLPFGLTEQAIEAARKMRFEPEEADGRPRTTTRPVSFTFNIY